MDWYGAALAITATAVFAVTVWRVVYNHVSPAEHVANLLRVIVIFNIAGFYWFQACDPDNRILGYQVERLWSRLNVTTILALFVVWLLAHWPRRLRR